MVSKHLTEWTEWEKVAKQYLFDAVLTRMEYPAEIAGHDHCELCWARFSNSPDDLQEGYYDKTNACWICDHCYTLFRKIFNWQS